MKTRPIRTAVHKLGTEAHELAKKPRKLDKNFAQSRDIHEDRGAIQSHLRQTKAALGKGRAKTTS